MTLEDGQFLWKDFYSVVHMRWNMNTGNSDPQ